MTSQIRWYQHYYDLFFRNVYSNSFPLPPLLPHGQAAGIKTSFPSFPARTLKLPGRPPIGSFSQAFPGKRVAIGPVMSAEYRAESRRGSRVVFYSHTVLVYSPTLICGVCTSPRRAFADDFSYSFLDRRVGLSVRGRSSVIGWSSNTELVFRFFFFSFWTARSSWIFDFLPLPHCLSAGKGGVGTEIATPQMFRGLAGSCRVTLFHTFIQYIAAAANCL